MVLLQIIVWLTLGLLLEVVTAAGETADQSPIHTLETYAFKLDSPS